VPVDHLYGLQCGIPPGPPATPSAPIQEDPSA
jgi:hypothetical protein